MKLLNEILAPGIPSSRRHGHIATGEFAAAVNAGALGVIGSGAIPDTLRSHIPRRRS